MWVRKADVLTDSGKKSRVWEIDGNCMFLEGSWLDGVKEFLSVGQKADGRVLTVDVDGG